MSSDAPRKARSSVSNPRAAQLERLMQLPVRQLGQVDARSFLEVSLDNSLKRNEGESRNTEWLDLDDNSLSVSNS